MTVFPPTIKNFIGKGDTRKGIYARDNDTAKFIVGRNRFERPSLEVPHGPKFEWPLGIEGINFAGAAVIAEQKFIGDNDPFLTVMHLDDQRIRLTGMFPGLTGSQNMRDLMKVIRAPASRLGKILRLPSNIYPSEIYVMVADYDFDHPEDDREQSWAYTITLRRKQIGVAVKKPKKIKSPVNPTSSKGKPKGKSSRIFTVHSGANTLRAVAQTVYGNPNRWGEIYNLNKAKLNKLGIPIHLLPTKRLKLGMKLAY